MLYEFRTLKDRHHASLIMLAGCESDIEAILVAQHFLRKGEGLEVWRGDKLIYRLAARLRPGKRPPRRASASKALGAERTAQAAPWLEAVKRLFRQVVLQKAS